MINSPLEQFNILSVYDASLANSSVFEIMYAKILLTAWYTFYNFPVAIAHEIGTNNEFLYQLLRALTGPAVSAYGMAGTWNIGNAIPALFQIVFASSSVGAPAQFIQSFIWADLFAGPLHGPHHSFLSLVWHIFLTSTEAQSLLYSADHVYATKLADIVSAFVPTPDATAATNGLGIAETSSSIWLDWNFNLVSSSLGTFLVNTYLAVADARWSFWSMFAHNVVRSTLTLTTKDFSYLILSLNSSTLWLSLGFVFTTFLLVSSMSSTTLLAKNSWQIVFEMFYQMVLDVVNQNAGPAGRKFFPLIFTTFTLILFCNLLGMIPYSFTTTSHLIVTFSMALAIFIGINILGILKNGTHFLSLFFPPGAPLALAPFLVLIEFVTYIFKVLSLAIRLFANLMSGHTLLKILSTFGWAAVSFWGIFIVPLAIIFLVTGLELAIGFLQAYIFSVLLCLYIHDAIELH